MAWEKLQFWRPFTPFLFPKAFVRDIEKIFRGTGPGRIDPLEISFENPLPILPAYTGKDSFQSYLLAIPGDLLASFYEDYGDRLLEQNVRTFLQFRGKVNKGLRNTIVNYPEMFFAYNNGVTATANSVEISKVNGRHELHKIYNLQIVNGGQTTASLLRLLITSMNLQVVHTTPLIMHQ